GVRRAAQGGVARVRHVHPARPRRATHRVGARLRVPRLARVQLRDRRDTRGDRRHAHALAVGGYWWRESAARGRVPSTPGRWDRYRPRRGRAPMTGLVLAAGAGRRFGGPKALVDFRGARLVDRAVSLLRAGGCDRVVVVSGAVELEVPGA